VVSIPNTQVRYIQSSIVGNEYRISIALPSDYSSSDTTYPVLYVTDANANFVVATQILWGLQAVHEVPQVLIVGIGYRTDSLAHLLRSRDLTPTPFTFRNQKFGSGGGPLFLKFMREELKPFIRKNYRVSSEAAFAGYSYGALFGLYTLFHAPETFQRYFIGSPSLWYDSLITFKYEKQYASTHTDLPAKIFMSVGSLEEAIPLAHMVTNMKKFADTLQSRHYPNLHLTTHVFEEEKHSTGGPAAFSRGMRVIYQKEPKIM
jgi:predicted alpha/beta superfamily hydrolase